MLQRSIAIASMEVSSTEFARLRERELRRLEGWHGAGETHDRCLPDHLFDVVDARALWLQLRPQAEVGAVVGQINILELTGEAWFTSICLKAPDSPSTAAARPP